MVIPSLARLCGSTTRVYSPTLIVNGRFGITRLEREDPPNPYNFSPSQLGFASNFASQMVQPVSFPNVAIAGYSALGEATAFTHQAGTSYSFSGSVTKVHGDHTIKAGVDYRINQSFEFTGFNSNSNFGFTAGFTQDRTRTGRPRAWVIRSQAYYSA